MNGSTITLPSYASSIPESFKKEVLGVTPVPKSTKSASRVVPSESVIELTFPSVPWIS
jgi:hypothetical protein